MRTHLDVYELAYLRLTPHDQSRLGGWIAEVVGSEKFVRGVDLIAEGGIRVEIYVDAEGNPATQPSDIHIDRVAMAPATKWFEFTASEPPPVWPD